MKRCQGMKRCQDPFIDRMESAPRTLKRFLTPFPAFEIEEEVIEDLIYDEKTFFERFCRSRVRGKPEDRMTIGQFTEFESRFHDNCVENAISFPPSRGEQAD